MKYVLVGKIDWVLAKLSTMAQLQKEGRLCK